VKLSRVSVVVVIAVSAFALTACSSAHAGPKGSSGAHGSIGKTGAKGSTGAQGLTGGGGATGAAGPAGANGSTGAAGPTGATGATGTAGAPGATGPTGPAVVSQYAYVYNLTSQTVAQYGTVVFGYNGDISSGFVHAAGTSQIVVNAAGEYEVSFSVDSIEPIQFSVSRNGAPVPGTNFGSSSGEQETGGTVILSAAAGDVLAVLNDGSNAADLDTSAGGWSYNANATFAIQKIG
jgi:hypothetical protein